MAQTTLSLGQIVESKAGRDKGRCFLVMGFADANFVWLADGDLRKVQKPKRKKLMHVKAKPVVVCEIQRKLLKEEPLLDAEVRKALEVHGFKHLEPETGS